MLNIPGQFVKNYGFHPKNLRNRASTFNGLHNILGTWYYLFIHKKNQQEANNERNLTKSNN